MIKIDVNHVKYLLSEMKKIDDIPFEEIEWLEGDEKLDIPQSVKDRWKFIGMTNCAFIEYYQCH